MPKEDNYHTDDDAPFNTGHLTPRELADLKIGRTDEENPLSDSDIVGRRERAYLHEADKELKMNHEADNYSANTPSTGLLATA